MDSDLLNLRDPSKDSVTEEIGARLLNNKYVKIGSQVLIAAQSQLNLENEEYVEAYKDSLDKWNYDANPLQLINNTYFRLRRLAKDQTIAYFGNGGKIRDHMISHLGKVMGGKRDTKYCAKVVTALNIHELFTSCLINDQSSQRCGIIVQAQINERGHLNGYRLTSTLFEYNRVVSKGSNQRNFDVFYALLQSTSEIKSTLHLGEPNQYSYLSQFSTSISHKDGDNFRLLDNGLSLLNLSSKSKLHIYSILAGILHLGNIQFSNTSQLNEPCKIQNTEVRDIVALLFSVDPSALEASLTIKTTITDGEYFTALLNKDEAKQQTDLLASQLYAMVYAWFIEHVNKRIAASEYANTILFVDLKPIYIEKENELVDFINNSVYQHFHETCIKQILNTTHFRIEGLPKNDVQYKYSNTNDLLFSKNSVLTLINTHKDYATLLQQIRKEFQGSELLSTGRSSTNFGIDHFNGTVFYEGKLLTHQNQEYLSNDLVVLMAGSAEYPQSENAVLYKIFTSKSIRNLAMKQCNILVPIKGNKKRHCKGTHYLQAYSKLVEIVQETMVSVVYVVPKSNNKINGTYLKHYKIYDLYKELLDFKGDYVASMTFSDFLLKYSSVLNVDNGNTANGDVIELYKTTNHLNNSDLYLGQRQVMIGNKIFVQLESKLRLQQHLNTTAANDNISINNSQNNSQNGDDQSEISTSDMSSVALSVVDEDDASIADTIVNIPLNKDQEKIEEVPLTTIRKRWLCCVYGLTFFIPDFCIRICGRMKRGDVQLAWREKVALCLIILLMSLIVLFFIVGLGPLICPLQNIYSPFELTLNNEIVSAYGKVYSLNDIYDMNYVHSQTTKGMKIMYGGKDVSSALVQFRPANLYCNVPTDKAVFLEPPPRYADTNATKFVEHHKRWLTNPALGSAFINNFITKQRWVKELAWAPQYVNSLKDATEPRKMVIISKKVYDLTFWNYKSTDPNYKFFSSDVTQYLQKSFGTDLSDNSNFMQKWNANENNIKQCFNNLFYVGVRDDRLSIPCVMSNVLLLTTSVLLVLIIGIKFLAALRSALTSNPEEIHKYTIIQIPCYSEGEESIRRTIDSCANCKYSDQHKLLFLICDGLVMGSGNDRTTPQIVLDILGVSTDVDAATEPLSFVSIGEGSKQHNMGKVFSGLYGVKGHLVPFIVVVKCGRLNERIKPGNRGKRDSQMILMRFLNKVIYKTPMSPLELEIYHNIQNTIGVDPNLYELVLMVDADTEILKDSLTPLVARMNFDASVMGCCGETRISNENQSVITMIQVYEYYISHHLSKAFESMFGSVTCLPGCFCMYRIRSPVIAAGSSTGGKPLLVNNQIIEDYGNNQVDTLHKKNLLSLGEDRYLTTVFETNVAYAEVFSI
eukprot:NODE_54_length_26799_cov_0.554794.p1 type:complete len:1374 gc:universal NODE_54_length_26799_cov_0.554794:21572-17451(-)